VKVLERRLAGAARSHDDPLDAAGDTRPRAELRRRIEQAGKSPRAGRRVRSSGVMMSVRCSCGPTGSRIGWSRAGTSRC
jgi:hypothetical protein